MKSIYQAIDAEIQRTYVRVEQGEFPAMRDNALEDRLCILVEELGEIAELVKIVNGKKPRHRMASDDRMSLEACISEELVQLAAIAVDWMTCD